MSGLNVVIENLNRLLASHLSADIRELITNLKLELENLKGAMGDLSRYVCESEYLKTTSDQIRRIVDEAEDAVDTYIVSTATQKLRGWMSRLSLQPRERKDAGKQIECTTAKLNWITEKHKRMLNPLAKSPTGSRMTSEVPRVEEDRVVGFEKPAKEVLEVVVKGPRNLEVIAIAGMSGLGKTTLAKMVYKDPSVECEYMVRAFVTISRQYDKKDVLLQILTSFSRTDDEVKNKDEAEIEKYVCQQLKGEQYLIVLDDVWELKDWDEFKGAFPYNEEMRCKVLITTTNVGLAEYANPTNPNSLYRLDFLSREYSIELLRWKVFGQDKFPTEEIEEYAKQIAEKCDGLPLAIVLIAGVLRDQCKIIDWWKEVNRYVSKIKMEILEILYKKLPNELKLCLIYLGVFPPGYEIPVWKLVRLWISEGFVDGEETSELEATAEQYLEELVQRNLVMVVRRRSNGKMKTCHLHDTLHEFCKKMADDENLFQEVNLDSSGHEDSDNCRRLCINDSSIVDYLSGQVSGKSVRSFLTFQKESIVDEKHVSVIQKTFKLLRVLEIHSLWLPSLSTDLSRLVLLKYLALSSNFSSIPSTFSTLWNLQTLIVKTTSKTLKVEMDLWKMPNFRHFHTNSTASLPSPDNKTQKSEESSLQPSVRTLCTISTECCSKKVLDRTPKLNRLGIRGDLSKFYQVIGESGFGGLKCLEILKLINDTAQVQTSPPSSSFRPPTLPKSRPERKEMSRLPTNLTKLTLMKTHLQWNDMSIIGKLEKLEVLKLKQVAFQENKWTTEGGSFPRLAHLYIASTGFSSWVVASPTQGAYFPELKTLQLNGCEKLEPLPAELVKIPSLQSLVLCSTNPDLASSTWKHVQQINKPEREGDKNKNLRLSVYPNIHHLDTQAESSSPSPAQMAPEEDAGTSVV